MACSFNLLLGTRYLLSVFLPIEITALSNILFLNTLGREGSFERCKGISSLDQVPSVCEPRKQGIIEPPPWQNHLPYSHWMGKSNGNKSATEKFTPATSAFVSHSYCQATFLNPVSCFPGTWWNQKGDFWHSAVGGAWQWGSITWRPLSKSVPDGDRDLSKSQTCWGGSCDSCVTVLL